MLGILVLASYHDNMAVPLSLIFASSHEPNVVTLANLTENVEHICDSLSIRISPNHWDIGTAPFDMPT
ncbi:hypothetical protein M1N47_02410 [Dehalococcoidia bacterium]|nr:hypothetical protein [Dehalococcoidia bacterium]